MPLKYNPLVRRRSAVHFHNEMSEGRRTQVILLDDRRLDIVVQPKLFVSELLNIVASHCLLKDPDKQYFGLAFYDENRQCHWLQSERRVLDHEYPRKFVITGATLTLFHLPKFYVESITQFAHTSCIELMFLYARSQLLKGQIELDNVTICQLSSYIMQVFFGQFTDMVTARRKMKQVPLFPSRLTKDPALLAQCEDRVLEYYQGQRSLSKGVAVVNFMLGIERSQSYGIQCYEVQDKAGVSLTLAISSRGIYQYDLNNLLKPRRVFYWKQLENLYYRDRKFSVEVNDVGRVVHTLSSFNVYEDAIQEPVEDYDDLTEAISDPSTQVSVSRRAFLPSGVYVHVFWCETAQLCKTIWSLAIAQHQFYLDRRATSKKEQMKAFYTPESLAEKLDKLMEDGVSCIARNLTENPDNVPRLSGSVSSTSLRSFPSSERSEEEKQRDLELYKRLKSKKLELEQLLVERTKELKEICIREGDLTGELPPEIRRALAPGEPEPKIKRRVGTAFAITYETMTKHKKADQIAKLEADVEIHKKIVAAALKLANDSTTNKSVRRKRRRDYEAARQRLRELEQRLHQLRISSSKPDLPNAHFETVSKLPDAGIRVSKSLPGTPHGSVPDLASSEVSLASVGVDFGKGNRFNLTPFSSNGTAVFAIRPPNLPLPLTTKNRQLDNYTSSRHKVLQHSTSFPCEYRPLSPLIRHNFQKAQEGFGEQTVEHNDEKLTAKPPLGSSGYRCRSILQSGYRNQNFPTLSSINYVKPTDSSHSLHDDLTPVTSCSAAAAIDHAVGAYNISKQRTSWDYECLSEMNSGVASALLRGSSESLDKHASSSDVVSITSKHPIDPYNGKLRQKGPLAGFSMEFYSGSLDRRLLNQRRDNWRPPARSINNNGNAVTHPRPLEIGKERKDSLDLDYNFIDSAIQQSISPRFVQKLLSPPLFPKGRVSPVTHIPNGGGIETIKPYETSDLIKYGGTLRPIPVNQIQNGRCPTMEQGVAFRKLSSPSPTSSVSSHSPARSIGSPKRVENWWASQVANSNGNNMHRNYPAVFNRQRMVPVVTEQSSNGIPVSDTANTESWYDNQIPRATTKEPTIV